MNELTISSSVFKRFWIYQRERFPVFKHGLLIASFSFCAVCLSVQLRFEDSLPNIQTSLTSFLCLFCFFLQLRILDEFKDFEKDSQFRPERPVPRGIVSLKELKTLGLILAILQLVLCYLLHPQLPLVLTAVWAYIALMTCEFFVPRWLQSRPFTYLWTHMLVMPFIDFFATSCDWIPYQIYSKSGLIWFLAVSFFNGIVIEIGRKTWSPEQERLGVDSYSQDWGIKKAISFWLSAIIFSLVSALMVASEIQFFSPVAWILLLIALPMGWCGVDFIRNPTPSKAKRLENLSGLWAAGLYLTLGILSMGYKLWTKSIT